MADFNYLSLKIGRDRKLIGYFDRPLVMSDLFPPFDYISLNISYSFLNFSFLHGKLIGNLTSVYDSTQGTIRTATDKYLAYHRVALNFSKHFSLALGEMVIYSNRSLDFSYLNPFNFYKSVEHLEQDRDNTLLFVNLTNSTIKGMKFFLTYLIDDIDFSQIGTEWYRK